jgi:hypothetical protein
MTERNLNENVSYLATKINKTILFDGFSCATLNTNLVRSVFNSKIDLGDLKKIGYVADRGTRRVMVLQSNYANPMDLPLLSLNELRSIISNLLSFDVVRPNQGKANRLPVSTFYLKRLQESLTSDQIIDLEKGFIPFEKLNNTQKDSLNSLIYHTFYGGLMNKCRILDSYIKQGKVLKLENLDRYGENSVALSIDSKTYVPLVDRKLDHTNESIKNKEFIDNALNIDISPLSELVEKSNLINRGELLSVDESLKSKRVIYYLISPQDWGLIFRDISKISGCRLGSRNGFLNMSLSRVSRSSINSSDIEKILPPSILRAVLIRSFKFTSQNYLQSYKKILIKRKYIDIGDLNFIGESALCLYLADEIFKQVVDLSRDQNSLINNVEKSFISKRDGNFQIGITINNKMKIQVQYPPAVTIGN